MPRQETKEIQETSPGSNCVYCLPNTPCKLIRARWEYIFGKKKKKWLVDQMTFDKGRLAIMQYGLKLLTTYGSESEEHENTDGRTDAKMSTCI